MTNPIDPEEAANLLDYFYQVVDEYDYDEYIHLHLSWRAFKGQDYLKWLLDEQLICRWEDPEKEYPLFKITVKGIWWQHCYDNPHWA